MTAGDVLACDRDMTFFVACYNEEKGIIPTLETVIAAAGEAGCSYDIVIIDDASADQSVPKIKDFISRHPEIAIKLIINRVNMGLGNNFAEGSFHGRGKYYRTVCGDDVEVKESMVRVLSRLGQADIILTYPENKCRGLFRLGVSRFYTFLINLLSGNKIRYYNGLPVTLRYDVMRWHSNCHGFGFQADLVTRLLDLGANYIEVPVPVRERQEGSSKALKLKNILSVAHTMMDIFIRRSAFLVYKKSFIALREERRREREKTPALAKPAADTPNL